MNPSESRSLSAEENYNLTSQEPVHIPKMSGNIDNHPESSQATCTKENNDSTKQESSIENKESEDKGLSKENSSTMSHQEFYGWSFPSMPSMQFCASPLGNPFQFPPYSGNLCYNYNNGNVSTFEHSQTRPSAFQVPRLDETTNSRNVQNNKNYAFLPPYPQNCMYYHPMPVIFCAGNQPNHLNNPGVKSSGSAATIGLPHVESNGKPQTGADMKIPREITSFTDDFGRHWSCLDPDSCRKNKEKEKVLIRKTAKIPNSAPRKATVQRTVTRRSVVPSEGIQRNIVEDGTAQKRAKVKARKNSTNDLGTKTRLKTKQSRTDEASDESDKVQCYHSECGPCVCKQKSKDGSEHKGAVSSSSESKCEMKVPIISWGNEVNILAKANDKRLKLDPPKSRNNKMCMRVSVVSDDDVDESRPISSLRLNEFCSRPRVREHSMNGRQKNGSLLCHCPNRFGVTIAAENVLSRSSNVPESTSRSLKKKGAARKTTESCRMCACDWKEESDNDSISISLSSDSEDDILANVRHKRQCANRKRNDISVRQRRSDNNDWKLPKPQSMTKKLKKIQSDGLFQWPQRSSSPKSGNESKKNASQDEARAQRSRTGWPSESTNEEYCCQCQSSSPSTFQTLPWPTSNFPNSTVLHHHASIEPCQSTSHNSTIQNLSPSLNGSTSYVENIQNLNNDTILNTLTNGSLSHRSAIAGRFTNVDRPLEENRYRNNILRRAAFNVENLADFRVSNNERLGRLESQLFRFNSRGSELNNLENNLEMSISGSRRVRLCPTSRNQNNFDLLTPHLEMHHQVDDRRLENGNLHAVRCIRRPSMLRPRTPRNGGNNSSEEAARQNWKELERVTYRRPRSANTVRKNPITKRNPKLAEEFNRIQNSDYGLKLKENLVKEEDSRENTEAREEQEFQENDENDENNRECDCEEEQNKNTQPEQDYEDEF